MKRETIILFFFMLICNVNVFCQNPVRLIGISLNYEKKEIIISVVSTGCTEKNDFKFIWNKEVLTIVRAKEDYCKAVGKVVSFIYSMEYAKINSNKAFKISNDLIANPFLANIH